MEQIILVDVDRESINHVLSAIVTGKGGEFVDREYLAVVDLLFSFNIGISVINGEDAIELFAFNVSKIRLFQSLIGKGL